MAFAARAAARARPAAPAPRRAAAAAPAPRAAVLARFRITLRDPEGAEHSFE
jgi:hypothetical protein